MWGQIFGLVLIDDLMAEASHVYRNTTRQNNPLTLAGAKSSHENGRKELKNKRRGLQARKNINNMYTLSSFHQCSCPRHDISAENRRGPML